MAHLPQGVTRPTLPPSDAAGAGSDAVSDNIEEGSTRCRVVKPSGPTPSPCGASTVAAWETCAATPHRDGGYQRRHRSGTSCKSTPELA